MCWKNVFHVFEFERYVVYRFGNVLCFLVIISLFVLEYLNKTYLKGKNVKCYGPGYIELLKVRDPKTDAPYIDDIKKIVDKREKCYLMPMIQCTTKDRIELDVEGLCFYEIYDPIKGVLNCEGSDVDLFIQSRAQSLLRDAIETHTLQQIMQEKQQLQNKMRVGVLFSLFSCIGFLIRYIFFIIEFLIV